MIRRLAPLLCLAVIDPTFAHAQTADASQTLSPSVIFVTSTGYWEESGDPAVLLDPENPPSGAAGAAPEKPQPARRGYYKLIAERQPDGTAHIYLQQIALGTEGPEVVSSAELEEFSQRSVYVTDIRPETSSGVTTEPGMFATVYLRTDPAASEPESWTVLIDDLGDIKVERASN
ncbi:hypothetical protein [Ensifer soli]|uniref:hypothetical protein n=1 Tax=Ciceribacter sp. sgz301302 TaxID=3342379 RepID=UPI0035BAAAD5